VVQARGADHVTASVAREEGNALTMQSSNNVGVRRAAKWRVEGDFLDIAQCFHLIDPAATDYAKTDWFSHNDTPSSYCAIRENALVSMLV
jgi:hypothetical protein